MAELEVAKSEKKIATCQLTRTSNKLSNILEEVDSVDSPTDLEDLISKALERIRKLRRNATIAEEEESEESESVKGLEQQCEITAAERPVCVRQVSQVQLVGADVCQISATVSPVVCETWVKMLLAERSDEDKISAIISPDRD